MSAPHEVLGVDPAADDETVVAAYRNRVKEVHPDQGGSTAAFRTVQDAYEAMLAGERVREEPPASPPGTDGRERWVDREPTRTRPAAVEYLDYEVCTDRGWSIDDEELFARAAGADLADVSYGRFEAEPGESLLEAAEARGYAWPFACRGGACANCAVAVVTGALSQPVDHILPAELVAEGIHLSCNGEILTDELQVVFNVKSLPVLADLRLPPGPFAIANPEAMD